MALIAALLAFIVFAVLATYAPLLLVAIGIFLFWLDHKQAKRMSSNPFTPHDPESGPN